MLPVIIIENVALYVLMTECEGYGAPQEDPSFPCMFSYARHLSIVVDLKESNSSPKTLTPIGNKMFYNLYMHVP